MSKIKHSEPDKLPELHNTLLNCIKSYRDNTRLTPIIVVMPVSIELEHIMTDLCKDLDERGIVAFTGDKHWLNFKIDHPEDSGFASFERILVNMRRSAGYRNRFGGVVRIDATAWIDRYDDERIDSLFAFIHDYSDEILFIISLSTNEPQEADGFKKSMSRWVNISIADITPADNFQLISLVEKKLAESGRYLDSSGYDVITEAVKTLTSNDYFAGIREINGLVSSIINNTSARTKLSAKHLYDYTADGQWIRLHSFDNRPTIGFDGGKR